MEEMDIIDLLSKRLQRVHISQEEMDYIYQDIVDMMKRNLKEAVQRRGAEKRRGQVWFHRGLQKLRKAFNKVEKQWLESRNEEQRKARRETYLEIRRSYKKAVRRAKREHEEKESDRLEATLQDPKKWWWFLIKKKVTRKKVEQVDLSRVIHGEGKIREGDGARKVWNAHFEQLLNEGAGDVGGQRETVVDDDRNEQLDNEITAKEVAGAMGKIKRKAVPGKDGLTAENRSSPKGVEGECGSSCTEEA